MKRSFALILFLLILGTTALGQPPFSKPPGGGVGGPPPFGKPPGGGFGGQPSGGQIAGAIIGGVINAAAEEARRERWRQQYMQSVQPRTIVVQQTQSAPTETPAIPVSVSANSVKPQPPLALKKNVNSVFAQPATKDVVNKAKTALKKEIAAKLESILDLMGEEIMDEEKANVLAKKFMDEGKDKNKITAFLAAVNNNDAAAAGTLAAELTGDPLEGNKITKSISFGNELSDIRDSIQNGDFGSQDFSDLKKMIGKSKTSSKVKKNIQKLLAGVKNSFDVLEIFEAYKDLAKTIIPAPTSPVTVVYCPSLAQNVVYAVNSETFMIYGDAFAIAEDDISYAFPQIPVYANPVPQDKQQSYQVSVVNSSDRTATYRLDDNASRTLAPGTRATFSAPKSGAVNISSRGRWKPFYVAPGTYSFAYSDGDWSLTTLQIAITLDNSENPLPLCCFAAGQELVVAAGESVTLNSGTGILEIQFARDENTDHRATYLFESDGVYKIGLDQRDNKWALFP
ncbi:hypothetical protein FACS189454_05270 [Planctomycetales bacterium]|nr:hypothetical protein FACS189454_05270 [Planctomycetales bacterium]